MKLTPSLLATIETYLLSWELQFRDFYDEMFDHFCSEIEQRMSAGTTFENALAETSYMFNNYEFRGNDFLGNEQFATYNVKAMEMERFYALLGNYQKEFLDKLKQQFLSWRIVLWLAMFIFFMGNRRFFLGANELRFSTLSDTFFGGILCGLPLATLIIILSKIPLSDTIFSKSFYLIWKKDLVFQKKYQLFKSAKKYAFINLLLKVVLFYVVICQAFVVFKLQMNTLTLAVFLISSLPMLYCLLLVFLKHRKRLVLN